MKVFKLRTFPSRQFSVIRIMFKDGRIYVFLVTDQLDFYSSFIEFTYIPIINLEM